MFSPGKATLRDWMLIMAAGMLAYLPFLGATPLFDWDEINFAESAREMIVTGNYFQVQVNFEPFWEKPPLFFWMQVASMKVFGINAFAARLPNALIGIATLCTLFGFGVRMRGRQFGWLLAGFFFASLLPFVYFKSGIIDPTFNLFIFLGLIQILQFEQARAAGSRLPWRRAIMAGIWIGLATLTKGPTALLVVGLSYLIFAVIRFRGRMAWSGLAVFLGIWAAVIGLWFGAIALFTPDGSELITKFIVYQVELFTKPVAGHRQPFYYHFVVFLLGCFPMSAFAFRGMFVRQTSPPQHLLKTLMLVWFWVILILFSIAQTKIVHYSSMLYFPGAVLAAIHAQELIARRSRLTWDTVTLLILPVLLFGGLLGSVNLIVANLPVWAQSVKDPFSRANMLAQVEWTGYEFIPGVLFLLLAGLGIFQVIRGRFTRFLGITAAAVMVLITGGAALVAPRVAGYSQGAATRFFQTHKDEDAYLTVSGYKSYAHYWYGQSKPFPHPEISVPDREGYFKYGPIDKPVYLSVKVNQYQKPDWKEAYSRFQFLYEEAGFVFLRRDPEH